MAEDTELLQVAVEIPKEFSEALPEQGSGSKRELTWDNVRTAINKFVALDKQEWAGAPLPVAGLELVVEPKYPYQGLNGFGFEYDEAEEVEKQKAREVTEALVDHFQLRNIWHCRQKQCDVAIFTMPNGKSRKMLLPQGAGRRLDFAINTLGAGYQAWTVEMEQRALAKLQSLVSKHAFECYFLTGSFFETSKRSGITYLFRKLRPTIATSSRTGEVRILAALCLHPIGFYADTWAGVMTPTDCVIARLLWMRGDEHGYWKHSNQHSPDSPEAGI